MSREARQGQVEHLQAKYVGTGHADLTKHEWATNQHRDSYASYIGHATVLTYFGLAHNESVGRLRYNMMQKMIAPCGPPPKEAANFLIADIVASKRGPQGGDDAMVDDSE